MCTESYQVVDGFDREVTDAREVDRESREHLKLLLRQGNAGFLEEVLILGHVAHARQLHGGAQGEELLLDGRQDVRRDDEEGGPGVDDDSVPVEPIPRVTDRSVPYFDVIDLNAVPLFLGDLSPLEPGILHGAKKGVWCCETSGLRQTFEIGQHLAVVRAKREGTALRTKAHGEAIVEVVPHPQALEHRYALP